MGSKRAMDGYRLGSRSQSPAPHHHHQPPPRPLPSPRQGWRPGPFCLQQAPPAWPAPRAAGAAGDILADGIRVWPVLCASGAALDTRGLPHVTRPSVRVKVSAWAVWGPAARHAAERVHQGE
jgi:hypothetical protein